ncbi:MAG: disulfide bond formation protein B [Pseudomonadota bacterium]
MKSADIEKQPGYTAGSLLMFGAIAALAIAWGFEVVGGYAPCPLCLVQRYAYYAAVPMAFVGLIALSADWRLIAGLLFLFAGLAFVANTGLGVYHAGVEWGWWPGPDTCSGGAQPLDLTGGTNLLDALKSNSVVSCTEATFRMFGLTFAGWNAVISATLAACGLAAANAMLDIAHDTTGTPA